MALLAIGQGPASYNHYLLREVLDQEVLAEALRVKETLVDIEGSEYSRSLVNRIYGYLDHMPRLVERVRELFEDVHILGSNFFCSAPTEPERDSVGDWHSGHSLYFGIEGNIAQTLWIPLHDVNENTGGRLKVYNGDYIAQMDDLLQRQVLSAGNSISNDHCILKFLGAELESGAQAHDMHAGDVLLFDGMLPHQAEGCRVERSVLTLRLVLGNYTLNRERILEVIRRYVNEPGECNHAMEYLVNLLRHGEFDPRKKPEVETEEEVMSWLREHLGDG